MFAKLKKESLFTYLYDFGKNSFCLFIYFLFLDPLATTTDIGLGHQQRPASADTLDFDDDDDNDEDDEDLFELVRRKYNLQIDSDEDDVDVKR